MLTRGRDSHRSGRGPPPRRPSAAKDSGPRALADVVLRETERVLLTYEQVRCYELPATEGKHGDSRWPAFARRYGFDPARPVHWEVEALEPAKLQRLVLATVDSYADRDVLVQQIAREEQQRRALSEFLGRWGTGGGGTSAWALSTSQSRVPSLGRALRSR